MAARVIRPPNLCCGHPWRVLDDSVKLMERLLVDRPIAQGSLGVGAVTERLQTD